MVTAVRWEAQVEKAFLLPAAEDILRMAARIYMYEKMTTNTVNTKLNPTMTVRNMMFKSMLEHERARIGGSSQKKWLILLDLQKFSEKVRLVFMEAFRKPMRYEPTKS